MERWYRASEISARIGMSTRFVQRAAQTGALRGRAIGIGPRRAWRFRESDVSAWLREWVQERPGPRSGSER